MPNFLPELVFKGTQAVFEEFWKNSNSGQFRTVGNCTPTPPEAEKLARSGKKNQANTSRGMVFIPKTKYILYILYKI